MAAVRSRPARGQYMPNKIRLITLTVFAVLALFLAACSGAKGSLDNGEDSADDGGQTSAPTKAADASGDDSDNSSDDGSSGSDDSSSDNDSSGDDVFGDFGANDLFASDGLAVLEASAEQYNQEITSMEATLDMHMQGGGADVSVSADLALRSPDAMYMSMQMDGDDGSGIDISQFGSMDMLVRDETVYMKSPLFGPQWIEMSFADMGSDAFDIETMLNDASAFEYSDFVDDVDGIEFVGEENIDGHATLHYRVSMDAADAMATLQGSLDSSGTGVTDSYADVSGPISVDIWLGKSDFLPYLMTMNADVTSPTEGSMSLDMTMKVTGYNTDVNIPDAPTDTISMEELFGNLFGDLNDDSGFGDFTGPGS